MREMVQKFFDKYDEDKSGHLNYQEFKKFFKENDLCTDLT